MRFRLGLAIGFGTGYYLGTKAGRERYLQLKKWVDEIKDSEAVSAAAEKAQALVDLGVERARDLVHKESGGGNGGGNGHTAEAPPATMTL